MARLSFRCDDELVQRVDAERGLIARETWLRWAVEQALADDTQAGALRGVEGHRTRNDYPSPTGAASARGASGPPTPAERPLGLAIQQAARSSSQAKRGVEPRPKKAR